MDAIHILATSLHHCLPCHFDKVQEVLGARGIDCQKVIGFDSDGAPVMIGKVNGVGVRLAGVSPFLMHIHCVAHRCALVASSAAQAR